MDSYETIDLKEMVFLILSHLKIIICTVLIGGILAFCISQFVLTPMYTAQTSLYVNNAKDTSGEDRINQTDINASQQLVNTYIAIIKSNSVLDRVASLMGDGSSSRELSDIVSATQINSTQLLKITVNHADPEKAQKIANLMAVTVTEQIGNFVKGSSVEIIDYAKLPSNASSPNKKMNTAIGLLLGLILSVLFVVVRDLLDTKIRDSEELAKTFDVPVLGYIPHIINANGSQKKKKKGSMASIAPDVLEMELRKERIFGKETNFFVREAYKTLRTNITLSLSGTGCRTIAVSSSSPSEGKSTNCINIAASMAELGKKVLLVDCDMRKPIWFRRGF